jgi:polysaccharide deacetylase 2 family uncharacterized protein YibQ
MAPGAVTLFFILFAACNQPQPAAPALSLPARVAAPVTTAIAPPVNPITAPASAPLTTAVAMTPQPIDFLRFFAIPVTGGWRFPTPYHYHEWRLAAQLRGRPRMITDAAGKAQRLEVAWAPPRIVILIDDLGNTRAPMRTLARLPFIVNGAVLPQTVHAAMISEQIRRAGGDVLLHLPLEPQDSQNDPGPGALFVTMPAEVRRITLAADWNSVPGRIGFNNHMGSRFTSDAGAMDELAAASVGMAPLFIDSRTVPGSLAARAMLRHGIAALGRTEFLDDDPSLEAVSARLEAAIQSAKRDGVAIAIGHPNRSTLRVLEAAGERLNKNGVRAVALHEIFVPR